jgi:glycosyltransferase involved in cell wall biosynthesis
MHNGHAQIDILLGAYNGHEYLEMQLESLFKQKYTWWKLLVRDDGSSDDTLGILTKWEKQLNGRMTIIKDRLGKLGAMRNFECLMHSSSAPYVAFCDQDDFWHEDKLDVFYSAMESLNTRYGPSVPLLVFGDLEVVNDRLEAISDSFWRYQKIDPGMVSNPFLLSVSNCVTGCATLLNRSAVECALPIRNACMHDWWTALCVARASGKFFIIREPTIKYRQHSNNAVGARNASIKQWIKNGFSYLTRFDKLRKSYMQAKDIGYIKSLPFFLFLKIVVLARRFAMYAFNKYGSSY